MAIDQNSILQLLSQLQGGGGPPISPSSGLKEPSLSGLQLGEQGMGFGGGGSILGGGGQGIGGGGTEGMGLDLLSLLNQIPEGAGAAGRTLGQFPTQFPSFGAGGLLAEPQTGGGATQGTLGQAGMGGGGLMSTLSALSKLGTLREPIQKILSSLFSNTPNASAIAGLGLPFGAAGEATTAGFPIEATGTAGPGGFFSGSGNIIPNLPGGGTLGATIPAAGEGTTAPFIAGGGPEAAAAIQAGEIAPLAEEVAATGTLSGAGGVVGGSVLLGDILSRIFGGRGIAEGLFPSGQLARQQALAGATGQQDLAALGAEQRAALAGQISPLQALQFISGDVNTDISGRNPVRSGLNLPLDVAQSLGFPTRDPSQWTTFATPPPRQVIAGGYTDPVSGEQNVGGGPLTIQDPAASFFQTAPGMTQWGPDVPFGRTPNTLSVDWSGVSPTQFGAFLNAYRGAPNQFGGYVTGSGDVAKLPQGKAEALAAQARQQAVNFFNTLTTNPTLLALLQRLGMA